METEDLFRVEFSEDGNLGVEFSEDFLSSSQDDQLQAVEAFFWKKMSEPAQDVSAAAAKNEIVIILAEALLGKLKRGERIDKDSDIDISLEEIMDGQNVVDSAGLWDGDVGGSLEDDGRDPEEGTEPLSKTVWGPKQDDTTKGGD